jgi:hypothetical protein
VLRGSSKKRTTWMRLNSTLARRPKTSSPSTSSSTMRTSPVWRQAMEASEVSSAKPSEPEMPPVARG